MDVKFKEGVRYYIKHPSYTWHGEFIAGNTKGNRKSNLRVKAIDLVVYPDSHCYKGVVSHFNSLKEVELYIQGNWIYHELPLSLENE